MVTEPTVLLVSLLGFASCLVLAGKVWMRQLSGADLWAVSVSACVVGCGLVLESRLVDSKVVLQALMVGLVAVAALPPLLELRMRGSIRQHVEATRLPLLLAGLSTSLLLVNLIRNPLAPPLEIYPRVLAPAFWVLVALVALLGGLSRTTFVVGALAAFAAMCALMPLYPRPVIACHEDKCSLFGSLLAGPYVSENFLSVIAGSAVFLAWTLRRDAFSLLTTATAGVALVAAGGRGSLLGLALGALAAGALSLPWVLGHTRGWGPARRRALALLTVAAFATAATVTVLNAGTSDFSRRGNVWRRGVAVVREEWVLGAGLSRWDGYEGMAAVSHHYPHSQYLLVLFGAGVVGLVIYVVVMATALSSALASPPSAGLVGHVVFLLTVGIVEVVFNPLAVDGLSWLLLAHCFASVRVASPWPAPAGGRPTATEPSPCHEGVAKW